ncbi:MAG: hypothetical protein M1834_006758 [Cirrosporium novae-zelandiae]|nr:MAG: hypothetical protein M1834_006758 [Cirrosporium novae-zelandiae]
MDRSWLSKRHVEPNQFLAQLIGENPQAVYTSDLLYIPTLCLAKFSVLQVLDRLSVIERHKKTIKWLGLIVITWAVIAFLPLAFRCGVSRPWNIETGTCIDMVYFPPVLKYVFPHLLTTSKYYFWVAVSIIDILTEFAILTLPILMIRHAQTSLSKKIIAIAAFMFRIIVITSTILRLYYLHSTYTSNSDFTSTLTNTTITTQCVIGFTVITACIPMLKPFHNYLDTFPVTVSIKDPMTATDSKVYPTTGGSYPMHKNSFDTSSKNDKTQLQWENYSYTIGTEPNGFGYNTRGGKLSGNKNSKVVNRTGQWAAGYGHNGPAEGNWLARRGIEGIDEKDGSGKQEMYARSWI